MPPIGAIKRRDLIKNLRAIGFSGPHSRAKHEIMRRGSQWVVLPNPHRGDISADLIALLLRQAGISREEWESL